MIERRRPPTWDPPILLLVVGQLIEVTTLEVVVVAIVGGGSCLRGFVIWSHQKGYGGKRKQSNREYSSEVLSKQGSTLHMRHFQREDVYVDWAAEMPE
jgi:hypothetical protein